MESFFALLLTGYTYSRPVLMIGCFVLGLLIMAIKDKETKNLGLWLIASSLIAMMDVIFQIVAVRFSMEFIAKSAYAKTAISMALQIICIVSLVLYAKRRYVIGSWLVIVVIINRVGLTFGLTFVFQAINGKIAKSVIPLQYAYLTTIVSLIPALIEAVIVFALYVRNRKYEKDIKLFFIKPLISLMTTVAVIAIYAGAILTADKGNQIQIRNMVTDASMMVTFINMVTLLLAAVYILIKAPHKNNEY